MNATLDRMPATLKRGEVAVFKPEEAKKRDAQADAVISYAKRVKDWPLLEQAVEQKIEDQRQFVEWWDANVRDAWRPKKK